MCLVVKVGDFGGNILGIFCLFFYVNISMVSFMIIFLLNFEISIDLRDIKGWFVIFLLCIDLEILFEFVSIWEESCFE